MNKNVRKQMNKNKKALLCWKWGKEQGWLSRYFVKKRRTNN